MMTTIEVRPAASRDHTSIDWLDSRHSFSFGPHWDPSNTGHGQLIVSNDDRVRAGSGFSTHPHRDMEIVTWVLDGELEHADSERNRGVIYPGLAQRMSAGRGIQHSEINHSATDDVHFIQMWVVPDTPSIDPGYEQLDVGDQLAAGGLVAVASGRDHDAAIRIHQRGATLWVGRLAAAETVAVPDAPYVHLFVGRGEVTLEGAGPLAEGDAARLTGAGSPALTAGASGAEVLIWEMAA
jgi:quercetin 2,3-dioxygenase